MQMIPKTMRQTLTESGRFGEICAILDKINAKNQSDFPVSLRYDPEGNLISRVSKDDVKKGIILWYLLINRPEQDFSIEEANACYPLYALVDDYLNMLFHNYTVTLSHKVEPQEDLETIRTWAVLKTSLGHITFRLSSAWDEFTPFSVPKGWVA